MAGFIPKLLVMLLASTSVALANPRVLILVDSSYRQPVEEVAKVLKPQADVVIVPPPAPYTSKVVLENLDKLLGNGKWDLIYFNVGLVDMTYRAPGMKSFRVMSPEAGGEIATSPQDYGKNLAAIAKRLAGTKVIWANNLPIKASEIRVQVPGSETEYNKVAAEVMGQFKIPVSDMHGKVQSLTPLKPPEGRKAGALDKQPVHLPIIDDICKALSLSAPKLQ